MIKKRNPAFVVSTNNTRIVPNRRKATIEEIEAFQDDLRKENEKNNLKVKKDATKKDKG